MEDGKIAVVPSRP